MDGIEGRDGILLLILLTIYISALIFTSSIVVAKNHTDMANISEEIMLSSNSDPNPEKLTIAPKDENGDTPNPSTVTVTRLSDGHSMSGRIGSNECCITFDDSFIHPGRYQIEINVDASAVEGDVDQYWGYTETTIKNGSSPSLEVTRGMAYITNTDIEDYGYTPSILRFAPGDDIPITLDLDHPRHGERVKILVFIYPSGESRSSNPAKTYEYGSISGDSTTMNFAVEAPQSTGGYEIAFIVKTYSDAHNSWMTTDFVDGPIFTVEQLHAPTIETSSPDQDNLRIGKSSSQKFTIDASDVDSGENLRIKWYVDDEYVSTGSSFEFDGNVYKIGNHEIRAVATDGIAQTDNTSRTWEITISSPPNISPNPAATNVKIANRSKQRFEVKVTDPDTPEYDLDYTWRVDGKKVGSGDQFSFDATEYSLGTHTVQIEVSDGDSKTKNAIASWAVTLFAPPEITDAVPKNETTVIDPDGSRSFSVSARDPDTPQNSLRYEWIVDGVQVATGPSIEFQASNYAIKDHDLLVRISDGTDVTTDVTRYWKIKVVNPPKINIVSPDKSTVVPGQQIKFGVKATDPNGYPLVEYEWSFGGKKRYGERVRHTFQSIGTKTVTVTVTNSKQISATRELDITVEPSPPKIVNIHPETTRIPVGKPFTLNATVTDPAGRNLSFSYRWVLSSIGIQKKQSVNLAFQEAGSHSITLVVRNEFGSSTSKEFNIEAVTVQPTIVNIRPEDRQVPVGESFTLNATATDPAGRNLSFAYTWIIGNQTYQKQSVPLTLREVGLHTVELIVTNEFGTNTSKRFSIDIRNDQPVIDRRKPTAASLTVKSNVEAQFSAEITDEDLSNVTLHIQVDGQRVDTRTITDHSEIVTYTRAFSVPDSYSVSFVAVDGHGNRSTLRWNVSVQNRPPKFTNWTPSQEQITGILSGETIRFTAEANDPEGQNLEYEWSINGNFKTNGTSFTPTFEKSGTYTIRVIVTDPHGSSRLRIWGVRVQRFNTQPTVSNTTLETGGNQSTPITFVSLSVVNPDANDRVLRVEFVMDIPKNVGIQRVANVEESSLAGVIAVGEVQPGGQASMRVGVYPLSETFENKSITYTIRYYPKGQRQDHKVLDTGRISLGRSENDATQESGSPGQESGSTPTLTDTNGQHGFTIPTLVISLLAFIFSVKRR